MIPNVKNLTLSLLTFTRIIFNISGIYLVLNLYKLKEQRQTEYYKVSRTNFNLNILLRNKIKEI